MSSDAREALRRYLEQRRELGESELVLDSMSVDDVLRVVGARPGAGAPGGPPDDVAAPADHPRLRGEAMPPRQAPNVEQRGVAAEEPERRLPPELEGVEGGDWRAMLRAAGAATPGRPAASAEQPEAGMAPSPAPGAAATPTGEPADAPRAVPAPPTRSPAPTDFGAPTGLIVGGDGTELFGGPMDQLATLDDVARAVAGCTRCPLHRTAKNPVPGEGNPNADLVIVGEAPGAEEDATGRPFVGASGQLLTKILAAISLSREEVFICNVVKHRPPGNRNPEADEVVACSPYLVRQLELLRPKVILTLGNFAAQTLLGTTLGISKLRGQVHRYHGIPLVATYHPAALLRNPTWKRPTWEDVQLARRILDRAQPAG